MDSITLESPLDMHVHFRTGDMLKSVVPHTVETYAGALVMPNTVPPITTREMVESYRNEIMEAAGDEDFQPFMTLFFQTNYTRNFLVDIRDLVTSIKMYPQGITTNSETGVDPADKSVMQILEWMEELHIPLCVHGETEGFVMDREREFMSRYEFWAVKFPNLVIIMEHITTLDATIRLQEIDNLYATITAHHLYITLDDVVGGMLNPHLFCKPIAKRPEDRAALVKIMTHPKVMLGTDSAPHDKAKKESSCGCAGVYTAPISLQLVTQMFMDRDESVESLQNFVSGNARRIYGIDPISKSTTLIRERFQIPERYITGGDHDGWGVTQVVPMFANKYLDWSIK